jgi:hypothetical protein
MSGQQAYHKSSRIGQSSGCFGKRVLTWSDLHKRRNVEIGTQTRDIVRNMPGWRDVLMSTLTQEIPKESSAHFMPRQLRGPFENATCQLSRVLDPG